jgi:hypothetical protein
MQAAGPGADVMYYTQCKRTKEFNKLGKEEELIRTRHNPPPTSSPD